MVKIWTSRWIRHMKLKSCLIDLLKMLICSIDVCVDINSRKCYTERQKFSRLCRNDEKIDNSKKQETKEFQAFLLTPIFSYSRWFWSFKLGLEITNTTWKFPCGTMNVFQTFRKKTAVPFVGWFFIAVCILPRNQ